MTAEKTANKHSDQKTDRSEEHHAEHAPEKVGGFLGWVERVGNKLPEPFWLFVIIGGLVLVSSWLGSLAGLSAKDPESGETVAVKNMLSPEGLSSIVSNAVENYTSFPPLGLIITVMLGVAIAEHSGLIASTVRAVVSKVGPKSLTFVVALAGVTGSVASDAVYVILIPIGAMSFRAMGRSPIVGAMVAFAASSAGFNSSLVLNITDVLLAGISTSAANIADTEYVVSPLANYFFVMASAVVLALIITAVTELYINKKALELVDHDRINYEELTFGNAEHVDSEGSETLDKDAKDMTKDELEADLALSEKEVRALKWTGVAAVVFFTAYFAALFVPGSPLQGEGGAVMESPLITDVGVPIAVGFFLLGVVYGLVAKTLTKWHQVPEWMARGLKTLLPMMVLFFAVAQFLAWFTESNLGSWTAITGAEILQKADFPPLLLFGLLVLLVAGLNLLITSGSAQWALMAPIVVPMFMYLGYAPEVTQLLFRMGDSPSNIITPMSPYFALALTFLQRYYSRSGIGTLMSLALPYAVAMLIGWFLFFVAWWLLGIPLGPGTPMDYPA